MERIAPRRWTLVMAAMACVAPVACSSTGSKAAGPAPSAAPAGSSADTASTSGGGPGGGVNHPVNVCAPLPLASVTSVTGESLTVARENDDASYQNYTCGYFSADGGSGLTVSVSTLQGAVGYNNAMQNDGSRATPISGLGDKAYSTTSGSSSVVRSLFGSVEINVSGVVSVPASVTLIRRLQPKP
jgi:hypothetical protein